MAAVDRPRKRIKGRKTARFGHPLTRAQLKTLGSAAARYQPVHWRMVPSIADVNTRAQPSTTRLLPFPWESRTTREQASQAEA